MEITGNKFRQYLLGNLAGAESEKIDLQIITDDTLVEELHIAEDALMEDYLEGTLSPTDLELFHKNFLVSPERESQLKHLSLLKNYAKKKVKQTEEAGNTQIKTDDNFFQKLKNFFALNLPAFAAIAVFIILGLLVGIFYYDSGGNEVAEINRRDLSNVSEYSNLSNLSLISGAFRDTSSGNSTMAKDKLSGNVLIRLALPGSNKPDIFYNIKITGEQTTLATLDQVRSYSNQNGQELRLLLPASILKRGNYKIEAVPQNAQDAPFIYSFSIQ